MGSYRTVKSFKIGRENCAIIQFEGSTKYRPVIKNAGSSDQTFQEFDTEEEAEEFLLKRASHDQYWFW